MKSERRYDDLLEKFFDGSTDNREERIIYDMFRRGDCPPHWAPYAGLFAHFERGLSEEDLAALDGTEHEGVCDEAVAEPAATAGRRSGSLHRLCAGRVVRRAVAVAACAVLALTAVRIATDDSGGIAGPAAGSEEQRLAEEFRRWEEWIASEYDSFDRLKDDDPFNEFKNLQL